MVGWPRVVAGLAARMVSSSMDILAVSRRVSHWDLLDCYADSCETNEKKENRRTVYYELCVCTGRYLSDLSVPE